MGDIELVIKMPEELKEALDNAKKEKAFNYMRVYNDTLYDILKNGTPLPKGHGRLSDVDWVLNKMDTTDAQPITPNEHYAWDFARALFRNTPTIIEADIESEEEK